MRAFLAVEIDNHIKDNLDKTQQLIRDSDSANINFVKSENIHLTLKFFGDIDEKQEENICDIIDSVIKDYNTYTLKLVNVGAFRNINNPRVIWSGIKDKDDITIDLIKRLDNKFSKIGFDKERSYTPHITIGRVKSIKNRNKLREILKSLNKQYFGKMQVKRICLKSSKLTPNGPIYNTEKEFVLDEG